MTYTLSNFNNTFRLLHLSLYIYVPVIRVSSVIYSSYKIALSVLIQYGLLSCASVSVQLLHYR